VATPYVKPGTQPKLEMLLVDSKHRAVFDPKSRAPVDGAPAPGVREIKVVWFHGCKNPKGDLFFECYPELSRRLGEAFGGRPAKIDREIPGLVSFGTNAVADVPADTLSSRPPAQQGAFPQGRLYVFFAACGGDVTYDPHPPSSSGLPIRCVNPDSGEDLPAEEFVYGYTPLFVFQDLAHAHPTIEGATFGGAPVVLRTCDEGCPIGFECGSNNRCLPVVPRCTDSQADTCPKIAWKPIVSRASAEPDPISSALDGKPTLESLYVQYAATNGRFDKGAAVVNDPNQGWNDEHAGDFVAYGSQPGEATLFAVVRDNRGGQAWTSYDVIIR
jgi:hypothetical protein